MLRRLTAIGAAFFAVMTPSMVSAQSSPSAFTTGTRYDLMGRVVGTISPYPGDGSTTYYPAVRNTYDADGRLIKVETGTLSSWQSESVAPSSWTGFTIYRTTSTDYDAMDRKIRDKSIATDLSTKAVTDYSYDGPGRLKCTTVRLQPTASLPSNAACTQTDSSNTDRITQNSYDPASQLIQIHKAVGTSLDQAYATYHYTANGKQDVIVDANGNRAAQVWDGFDRLSQWQFPSTTPASGFNPSNQSTALSTSNSVNTNDYEAYTYDANGNRLTLRKRSEYGQPAGSQTIGYTYDTINRMTFKDWPGGGTGDVTYCYDAEGRQTDAVYGGTCASDPGVHNGYDAIGRLTSSTVNLGGNTRAMSWVYDADGNRTTIVYPGPNAFTEQYDGIDRPVRLLDFYSNVLDTFTYWATGERAGITRFNAQNTSYSYDGIGRLDTLGQPWVNIAFQYNAASQATQRTISNDDFVYRQRWDVNRPYTVNGLNQYSAVHGTSYGYDLNGNLTSDGTTTYGYDIENRLTSASGQLNGTLSYDPLGRLWQTTGASGTVQYFYDGDDLAVEYDGANNILRRYLHGPGADEPQMWYEGSDYSQPRWYHQDHQSSVIAITDYSGNRIATNTYDEYGNPTPGNTGRFQYTGQLWLKDFQLYHYKARAYSPWLGRFMQTDPVGYQNQVNLYAYVANDPLDASDPSGEICIFAAGSNGDSTACQRALYYAKMASDPQIASKTTFFKAASAVVNTLASVNLAGSTLAGVSDVTRTFLEQTGERLAAANIMRASQIASGQLYAGNTSVAENDRAFVRFEQGNLQSQMDSFKASSPGGYNRVISDVNGVLNGSVSEGLSGLFGFSDKSVRSAVDSVRKSLGRDINFGNLSDRIAIGDRLTGMARSGATLCTGSLIKTC